MSKQAQVAAPAKAARAAKAPKKPATFGKEWLEETAEALKASAATKRTAKAAEEATHEQANAAKLAKVKAQPKAEPAPLKKGSGALVGVAQGATDGQPHTKRAVEEARRKERQSEADKVLATLEAEEAATPKLVMGVAFPSLAKAKARREEVRRQVTAEGKRLPADPEAPKAAKKPAKAKAARAPKADAPDQKITLLDKAFVYGAEGTARRASWDACKASKTTAEYKAAGGAVKYLARWVAAGAIKLA